MGKDNYTSKIFDFKQLQQFDHFSFLRYYNAGRALLPSKDIHIFATILIN